MAKAQGWVMLEPGKMELPSFDLPQIEEDAALLKGEACGLCGSDIHAYLGHIRTAPFPMIPGHQFIGPIVEAGKSASSKMAIVGGGSLKEGDRVAIAPSDGSNRERGGRQGRDDSLRRAFLSLLPRRWSAG